MSAPTNEVARRRAQHQPGLAQLLKQRDQLGTRWAEHFSHGRGDVGQLTVDLMVTEASLADGWPHLAEQWAGEWAIADITKLHDPSERPGAECSICERRRHRAAA